jgi:hypothetical protein
MPTLWGLTAPYRLRHSHFVKCFNIYENDDILVTSGELLHKSSLDENTGISSDVFKFNELLSSKNQYSV